jgi:hypothetical protein
MRIIFTIAPILFGLDKFFNLLVDWPKYLAPWIPSLINVSPQAFMYGVGVVEIVAGILAGIWPQYFAYVVTLWLWGIIVNLLTIPGYYDVALRDFGLSLGALTLARLAERTNWSSVTKLIPRRSPRIAPAKPIAAWCITRISCRRSSTSEYEGPTTLGPRALLCHH